MARDPKIGLAVSRVVAHGRLRRQKGRLFSPHSHFFHRKNT
jgi:hypothetical protein